MFQSWTTILPIKLTYRRLAICTSLNRALERFVDLFESTTTSLEHIARDIDCFGCADSGIFVLIGLLVSLLKHFRRQLNIFRNSLEILFGALHSGCIFVQRGGQAEADFGNLEHSCRGAEQLCHIFL